MKGAQVCPRNFTALEAGVKYEISGAGRGIGLLYPVGGEVEECAVSVETGQVLTLRNIPSSLRDALNIGETVVVTVAETSGDPYEHTPNSVELERSGRFISFSAFAGRGVTACAGVLSAQSAGSDHLSLVEFDTEPAVA